MEELRKQNAHQKELDALREKQEQELAAMKVQSLYRGRKARRDLIKFREHRKAEMRMKSRELQKQIAATKIQGMFRCWKARQVIRSRKANLQAKWDVSVTLKPFSFLSLSHYPDKPMIKHHTIHYFLFQMCVIFIPLQMHRALFFFSI